MIIEKELMQENIKTYIINLEKRTSRRVHSVNQFSKKNQFKITLIKAIENKNGALGLWQTIVQIIENVRAHVKSPFFHHELRVGRGPDS